MGIFWAGLGLAVTLALVAGAIGIFLHFLDARRSSPATDSRTAPEKVEVPAPRLQTNPARELAELRAREERVLHSYEWVDRPSGVVRIPIERAIELTAQRGLPARKSPPATQP